MSDTLASLRRQLEGARQLESVVRAMKAIAASSIGQYEAAVRALADYSRSVELGLSVCLRGRAPVAQQTASRARACARLTGALVFGSDQGLVGRFNEAIAEFARRRLEALPGEKKLWVVGDRVYAYLANAGLPVAGRFTVPSSVAAITPLVTEVQIEIEAQCAKDQSMPVYVFHNRPRSAARYEPSAQQMLPLDAHWQAQVSALPWPTANLPEVLGGGEPTFSALVHEHLFISLYKACAESLASEHGSRLEAMQRAQKNIETLSANLGRSFNRLRQNVIDDEIFDVIAGFHATAATTPLPENPSP